MGNVASLPEKVFLAVQRNDVCGFQALVANLNTASTNNPAARAAVLEYKDKNTGRTPLLLAASKGHYQILQQLIHLGADIHYINAARDSIGGALHEAAARRHEAAVELLLGAGACPFVANAAGRTALDEAVLSGHTGVVRAIEAYADFSGLVAFKIRSMGGLSSKYKIRWAVLMPYYTLSAQGGSSIDARKPRRCLWLYKDMKSVSPRCRLWVDSVTVQMSGPAGTEGTLRLHTSHGEPVGDLATTYAHGYCVALRPSDTTPGAASIYHRLVSLLNGCCFLSGQQQPRPAAGVVQTPPSQFIPALDPATGRSVSVLNAALFPAVLPPLPPPPFYPAVPPINAQRGAVSAGFITLNPPPGVQAAPLVVPIAGSGQSLAYPGAAGPCPMASPLSLHQQRQRQATAPSSSLAAPGATPPGGPRLDPGPALEVGVVPASPQSQRVRGGDAPAAFESALGQAIGDRLIEHMTALPDESDEAFAARLSEAITARSGYSQQTLYPQQDTRPAQPAAVAPAMPISPGPASQTQQQRQSGSADGPGGRPDTAQSPSGPGLINFHSDPGNGPVPAVGAGVQRPGRPSESLLDELDMDAVNSLIAAEAATAAQARAPPASSGPSTSGGEADAALPTRFPMAPLRCAVQDAVPSAPPADPVTASPARPAPQLPEPEPECIICMNAPKEVGFLHGDSVHRCVCRECSVHVAVGAPCPLCRQPVERVLGVY